MNKNRLLIGGGIFGVILVVALVLQAPEKTERAAAETASGPAADEAARHEEDAAESEAGPVDSGPGANAGLEAYAVREPAPLPPSLEGTAVDGGVRADDQGRLIVEAQIRDLFEYYLSTLGSASLEEVKVWVARHLRANLPPQAAEQGWQLFQRYLDYRRSLDAIPEPGPDAGTDRMQAVMRQRNALRREKLGSQAADAFFAAQEAYDEYMLRRRRIQQNSELTASEKQQRLDQARADLPGPMREIRRETTAPVRAQEHVEEMRAEGASEAEIRAWREANLGAEAADRLEQLEERRAQWERRYQDYREARAELDTSGLAEPEREAALQRLREKHFAEDELRRVEALDRLRAEQASERPDG